MTDTETTTFPLPGGYTGTVTAAPTFTASVTSPDGEVVNTRTGFTNEETARDACAGMVSRLPDTVEAG